MTSSKAANPVGRPRLFYGWYLVAASWVMLFLTNAVAVGIFFKPMLDDFGLDRATLASVQTVAMVVFAAASPFLGRLIDRFGPRAMLSFVVTAQTLSSVVNSVAGSLWHLYAGRFLYELKATHGTQVLINRWFVKKRGRALGIVASGMPLGALVLSPLSQYLVLIWGWRSTMLFWAGVTFIVLLPLLLIIRNRPEDKGYRPDGALLEKLRDTSGQIVNIPLPGMGMGTGIGLAAAVRTGSFWLLSATHLICGIGCGFMMTHIVIFATDMGYSAMVGASLLSVQGGINLVGVLLTGHMSDRIIRSRVLSLTHLIRSISFVTIVVFILLGGGSLWILYAAIAIFGFGWFTTSPLMSGLAADLFGSVRMGTIIGLILSSHMIGAAIGAYAGGVTFVVTGSYLGFFIVQGGLEFLAAVLAFAIKPPRPR